MNQSKGRRVAIGAIIVAALLVGFMGYVRMSPLDPDRWHQPVSQTQDADFAGGAVRVFAGDAETIRQLDGAMKALERTHVMAGSVDAGHITYVTRSAIFGFPDLTTMQLQGGEVRIYARLRFGASDLGVNRTRLERVIAVVE